MYRYKGYIAFLILTVFIFPVIYQEIHKLEHFVGAAGQTCEMHSEDQQIDFSLEHDHEEEYCPICDYEFVSSHFIKISVPGLFVFLNFEKLFFKSSNQKLSPTYFNFSSRAPPGII